MSSPLRVELARPAFWTMVRLRVHRAFLAVDELPALAHRPLDPKPVARLPEEQRAGLRADLSTHHASVGTMRLCRFWRLDSPQSAGQLLFHAYAHARSFCLSFSARRRR